MGKHIVVNQFKPPDFAAGAAQAAGAAVTEGIFQLPINDLLGWAPQQVAPFSALEGAGVSMIPRLAEQSPNMLVAGQAGQRINDLGNAVFQSGGMTEGEANALNVLQGSLQRIQGFPFPSSPQAPPAPQPAYSFTYGQPPVLSQDLGHQTSQAASGQPPSFAPPPVHFSAAPSFPPLFSLPPQAPPPQSVFSGFSPTSPSMTEIGGKPPMSEELAIENGIITRDSDGNLSIASLEGLENRMNNGRIFANPLESMEGVIQNALRPGNPRNVDSGITLKDPPSPHVIRQIQNAGNDFIGLTADGNGIIAIDPDRDRMYIGNTIIHTGGGSKGLISGQIYDLLRSEENNIISQVEGTPAKFEEIMTDRGQSYNPPQHNEITPAVPPGPVTLLNPRALQELLDNGYVDLDSLNRLLAADIGLKLVDGEWRLPGTKGYSDFADNVEAGAVVGHQADAITGGNSGLQDDLPPVDPVGATTGGGTPATKRSTETPEETLQRLADNWNAAMGAGDTAKAARIDARIKALEASRGAGAPASGAEGAPTTKGDTETYDEAIARRIANRDAARLAGDTAKVARIEAKIRESINAQAAAANQSRPSSEAKAQVSSAATPQHQGPRTVNETVAETYMRRVRNWQKAKAAGDTVQVRRIEALLNINAPAGAG